jgi:stage V sporulation protein S
MKMTNVEAEELKVSKTTNPSSLAGAIVKITQKGVPCEITAIGAGPINQAVKAVAIANRLLGSSGVSLSVKPCFVTLDLSSEKEEGKAEVTAIRFKVIVEK